MTVTSIRLQAELEEPLEVLAKKLDRSKNYLINQTTLVSTNSTKIKGTTHNERLK